MDSLIKVLIKGGGAEITSEFRLPHILWEPFKVTAPSCAVIAIRNLIANDAHSFSCRLLFYIIHPLVKTQWKIGISCQWQSELFWSTSFISNRNSRSEWSAPMDIAQILSYRYWLMVRAQQCLLRLFVTCILSVTSILLCSILFIMNLSPDLVPPLTKEQCIFIFAIPIGFQIVNQITRRCSKSLRALTGLQERVKLD